MYHDRGETVGPEKPQNGDIVNRKDQLKTRKIVTSELQHGFVSTDTK